MWLQKAITHYLQEEIAMVHSPMLEKKGKEKERKNINDLGNTVYQRPFI